MNTRLLSGLALGAAITLGCFSSARGQAQPAGESAAASKSTRPAEHALGLLKRSADKLSAATNFTFKTTSSVEVISPVGHIINYFSAAEVAVHRPNKLMAKKTGDGPSFDLFYDGKNFGVIDRAMNVYAEMAAPPTLDELIPAIEEKTGIQFPYADVLYSDIYGTVTKGLTHAYWVGKTTLNGVECDHLAFAGPGIEWQIWLGPEKDLLPHRLSVTFLELERQPRFLVNFTDWDLKASSKASRFEFKKPAGSKPVEFRPIVATSKK